MAEVQTNTQSGEMSQRFIEFVMMQAQNAALFLGQIPNPQTGKGEGNLTNEETAVLRNTLSNLQMAFVEVSRQVREGTAESSASEAPETEAAEPAAPASAEKTEPPPATSEAESRKKFTKSYGA